MNLDPAQQGGFLAALDARYTVLQGDRVEGELTATAEHHTPWGVVHGGVYATFIESAASIGASLAVEAQGMFAVGLDNTTDFVRAHTAGPLAIVATPVHQADRPALGLCHHPVGREGRRHRPGAAAERTAAGGLFQDPGLSSRLPGSRHSAVCPRLATSRSRVRGTS